MKEDRRKRYVRGAILGVLLGLSLPFVVQYLEGRLGLIVIQAIHQHWQWEQAQHLFHPALSTEKI